MGEELGRFHSEPTDGLGEVGLESARIEARQYSRHGSDGHVDESQDFGPRDIALTELGGAITHVSAVSESSTDVVLQVAA